MKSTASALVLVCALASSVLAQSLTIQQHEEKIKSLPDREKTEYVLKNNYALYSADLDVAQRLTGDALKIAAKNKWKDLEGQLFIIDGVIHFLKGDFDLALPSYEKANRILDSLKHEDGLARLYNELGAYHGKQGDTKTAMEYLAKSEASALRAGNQIQLATSYGHQGTFLERQGKVDEAFSLYNKVYEIRVQQKDSIGLGYALLDLASMALKKGDLKQSLAYIGQSTVIRKKIGDENGVAVNLVNTGETYFSVKDYKKAIHYFNECLTIAQKVGYTDLIQYTYGQLAASYAAVNDFKNAFYSQQKGKAFSDSLYNLEKAKLVADLRTKYETEKKEQEIELQRAELQRRQIVIQQTYIILAALVITMILVMIIFMLNRSRYRRHQQLLMKEKEISLQEAFIQASIQSQENERKRFAQDLHDGMGQLISALRLSIVQVDGNSTLEQRLAMVTRSENLLNEMHKEIRSIAFNLMPQTLVQHGLTPALKEMSDRINAVGKITIRINSFAMPERLKEVQEISIYRILQEWINNVIKYAGASVIEVQLVGYDNEISIVVEDNGRGFDTESLKRGSGNGWKNIRSRANLLRGLIDIDSKAGRNGTTFTLQIPLTQERSRVTLEVQEVA